MVGNIKLKQAPFTLHLCCQNTFPNKFQKEMKSSLTLQASYYSVQPIKIKVHYELENKNDFAMSGCISLTISKPSQETVSFSFFLILVSLRGRREVLIELSHSVSAMQTCTMVKRYTRDREGEMENITVSRWGSGMIGLFLAIPT